MFRRAGSVILAALIVTMAAAGAIRAQEKKKVELEIGKWYPKLDVGLVLSQSAYSNNWKGGEQGQVTWTAILNSSLVNQLHKSVNWSNTLKLAFGHTHNQRYEDSGIRVWDRPEKTTDLIDFETLFRFTMGRWVDPYVAGRLLSQFIDNSDPYRRSVWVSPMSIFASAGIAREFFRTEDEMFLSRVGGAVRENIRQFYPYAEPDNTKKTETSHDAGIEWVTDYKIKVLEDKVLWTSKLTVYKPFEYSFRGDLEGVSPDSLDGYGIDRDVSDYPRSVDINWENIFSAEVTSWLNFNLYFMFIYDKYDNSVVPEFDANGDLLNPDAVKSAIRKSGQFKQTLAVGLAFKLL